MYRKYTHKYLYVVSSINTICYTRSYQFCKLDKNKYIIKIFLSDLKRSIYFLLLCTLKIHLLNFNRWYQKIK